MHSYDQEGGDQANSPGCEWRGEIWKVGAYYFKHRSHKSNKTFVPGTKAFVSGRLMQSHASCLHRLLAIMGPSGGGKTSLLNALAGQVPETKGAQVAC